MPGGFRIRVSTPADEARVTDLLKASYPALMAPSYHKAVLASAIPLMTRANPKLLSSGSYYVAVGDEGRFVGGGGWTMERPGTGEIAGDLAHIRHFAVRADCTGLGVARAIYTRCETEARTAGVGRFECYSSLNAEGFYGALGFKRIRPISVPMGRDIALPSILMERSI